ncbi:MAG: uracil-DNA glycosylase [Acidobacteriota bacterium]|jgi:hypothetical protein
MKQPLTGPSERPRCVRCAHYFVTWRPAKPHGCRAMRFVSVLDPALVVFQSSGMHCHLFKPKTGR